MLGFIKRCFFKGLVFLSTLTSVNMLRCISMNNQECKVRPQIVNVNGDDPVYFRLSIKTSKCSGVVTILITHAQNCVFLMLQKNLNVKVFNLMSGTSKTKHIEWHETCKCECRFNCSVCNNKERWSDDKCRCECN